MARAQNQPPASQSQTTTTTTGGTFTGRLNGAGMDGATVTVTNPRTNAVQTAVTDANGSFTIRGLTPGSYRVGVRTKSGLVLTENTIDIATTTGNEIQVTFASTPTAITPTVEIEQTPTVQADSAEVSRSYESNTIRSLPLLDRQHHELITLMPGITPPLQAADRIEDPQRTRQFNVNGQAAYTNLYNQDGAYNNEPFSGRPLRIDPNEAVQALEVRTSNYNAEYGVAAGSWASNVTRPGTNAIHGSLFEFNTNSFFQTGKVLQATQDQPRFNINQFGGTPGGPIIPDKVFWFLSYEGYIQRGRQEAEATIPAANLLGGNLSSVPGTVVFNPFTGTSAGASRTPFANNLVTNAQINPRSRQIAALFPTATVTGFGANNLVGSVPLLDDNHRMDGKIDHRFNERSTGFLRYGFTQASVNQGSILGVLGNPSEAAFRGMNGVASLTQIFNTNLLAEFRFGYDRYRNLITPWGDFSRLQSLGFGNGLPSINIAGFSPLGFSANVPSKQIDNVYDGASNWVAHNGMHSLKFGVNARSLQTNGITNFFFNPNGSFIFGPGATLASAGSAANLSTQSLQANALAGFLLGTPTQAGVANFPTTPAYRQMQYAAYITDTLNLWQRLYLELGVRYDIFSPVESAQPGGAVGFDPATNTVIPLGIADRRANFQHYDLNNVAPRIGLAFRPIDRVVFRAGYGIHYFPVPFSLSGLNPLSQAVQLGVGSGVATSPFAVPALGTSNQITSNQVQAPNQPLFATGRDQDTPYLQTYSAMLQGDLGNGFLLDIGYVGSLGRQLPYGYNFAGAPGTGLNGLLALIPGRSALTIQRGVGLNSNYNSLQVNLTKRFAAGLSLAALTPSARRWTKEPSCWTRTTSATTMDRRIGIALTS